MGIANVVGKLKAPCPVPGITAASNDLSEERASINEARSAGHCFSVRLFDSLLGDLDLLDCNMMYFMLLCFSWFSKFRGEFPRLFER
jgi:hypothetical protein